jgi:hypothetical protein
MLSGCGACSESFSPQPQETKKFIQIARINSSAALDLGFMEHLNGSGQLGNNQTEIYTGKTTHSKISDVCPGGGSITSPFSVVALENSNVASMEATMIHSVFHAMSLPAQTLGIRLNFEPRCLAV